MPFLRGLLETQSYYIFETGCDITFTHINGCQVSCQVLILCFLPTRTYFEKHIYGLDWFNPAKFFF